VTLTGSNTFCAGGSATLSVPNVVGSVYAWTGGGTNFDRVVTTSGGYTVTVTNTAGCTATSSVTTITVNALPDVTVTLTGSNTFCVGGSATLSVPNVTGSVYAWTGGGTNFDRVVTTSGGYSVTVTNTAGCTATSSVTTITVNTLPDVTVTLTGSKTFCVGGSATLSVPNVGGSVYAWTGGGTNFDRVVTTSGGYAVTVTNTAGCTATSGVTTITVNALPLANITASGSGLTFCAGGFTNLTASGGTTYAWTGGPNTAAYNNITTSGTYSVTVTNAAGCTAITSTTITVNALPIPSIAASGSGLTFCAGGSTNLTASGGTTYAWAGGPTTAAYNNITTSGIYSVTVTNAAGCTAITSTTITVNALPVPSIAVSGSGLTFCAGGSTNLTASGGTAYAWVGGPNTAAYNNITTSGTYSVTVTNAAGCNAITSTTIIVNPLPTATITPNGPLTFCAGNSVNLTASNAVSYLWSNGATTNTISNITNSGTFSVTITDANGCSNTAAPVVVTVNALPTLNITNPTPICSPGTVNLTAAAITSGSSAGLQYSYWTNTTATTALTAPSSVGTSGTYYIRAVETVNNCSVIRPVTVAILPQAAMVVNTPAAVCAPNTIDITAAAVTNGSTAGLTYTYFTDALGTVTLNNANAIAQSGTYYIKGTPATGCSAVVPVQVIINPPPVLVVNNPTAVCAPSLIDLTRNEITAGSENNLRFNYFIDAALNAEIGNPAQINNSGTYYIRATSNVTGCRSSLPVTVTVNPIPSGQLQTPPVNFICENGTLTLTASGSANYQWLRNGQTIPGATTASYDAATAGTYTVRFISAQGCARQASENIVLELLSQPIVDFAVTNTCVGVSASFQNRSQTNNAGGINWLWEFGDGSSSNQFSTQYAYITPGVYQVRLTASNPNCAVSASKTMEYIVRTAARSVRYPDVETLRGVAVTVNARSNIGNQYLWSPVAGVNQPTIASPIITVNETTLYTVSITSDIGCVTTDTVLIKIIPGTDIFVPQGFTPNNDGQNDRLFPILAGMRQLNYFKVFNRWGNMIFSTNSATPAEGWNGVYLGAAQPTGAYTWIAEAVDLQGRVVRRTGTVMLLR
jgi:large repetitive protein